MDPFFKDSVKYDAFRVYYNTYGGWRSLLKSPYFAWSVIFWAALFPLWKKSEVSGTTTWIDLAFSSIPALLGFSLGSLSIILSLGSSGAREKLFQERPSGSYYLQVTATLFHFVIIQCLCLIFSLFYVAYGSWALSAIGFFLFVYALLSGLSAAAAIFGMMRIVNRSEQMLQVRDDE